MPMYDRSQSTACREIDRWSGGVGWLAHPDEGSVRASHAVREDGDVWLLDPLDAPGADDLVADLVGEDGTVAGVVVCSDYHARDAETFAERYDVAVHVPRSVDRVPDRIDAPVQRFEGAIAGFETSPVRPMYAWNEVVAYRERDGTLYVPDYLSSHDAFTVGAERVALPTASRLFPPHEQFAGMAPERICFGHGEGVFADADAALRDALEGARRRLPRALVTNLPGELRAGLGALF